MVNAQLVGGLYHTVKVARPSTHRGPAPAVHRSPVTCDSSICGIHEAHQDASCFLVDSQILLPFFRAIITNKLTVSITMSLSTSGQTSTPSSEFRSILDAGLSRAMSEYKKKTGKPLLDHPLAADLKRCGSVDAIKAIFQGQAEAFQQFRDGDQRLMNWIDPVVDVLSRFSDTLGEAVGNVRLGNPDRDYLKPILSFFHRHSLPQEPSSQGSGCFLMSVSWLPLFVDRSYHRRFIGGERCESEPRCTRRSL